MRSSAKSAGVLYLASGEKFVSKAVKSARSLKKFHPDVPITIYTDLIDPGDVFDQVVPLDNPFTDPGDSILSEQHFPYDLNLYLDADTYVCGSISSIFGRLERSEILAAQNVARAWWNQEIYTELETAPPESFPEYNSGVVAYRDTASVRRLFEEWNQTYDELGGGLNQPAFRCALYEADIRLGTLPPEYNFMTHSVGFASGEVRIVHQGPSNVDLQEFANRINQRTDRRVTTWDRYPVRVVPNKYKSRRYTLGSLNQEEIHRLLKSAQEIRSERGTRSLVQSALGKILPGLK